MTKAKLKMKMKSDMVRPENGDMVRMTLEGRWQEGLITTASSSVYFQFQPLKTMPEGVTLEIIKPPFELPMKRWAQVMDEWDMLWTRRFITVSAYGVAEHVAEYFATWVNLRGESLSDKELLDSGILRTIRDGIDEKIDA